MRILRKQFFERLQKNESLVVRGLLCTQRGRATRFKLHFGYASLNDDSVNSKVKRKELRFLWSRTGYGFSTLRNSL